MMEAMKGQERYLQGGTFLTSLQMDYRSLENKNTQGDTFAQSNWRY